MSVRYNEDFKSEVVRAYMTGDKTTVEIAAEYNIAKSAVSKWAKKYSKEWEYMNTTLNFNKAELAKEIRRLNKLLKEKEKEIDFKKSSGILCEGNRIVVYRFIDQNKNIFGLRWLCMHFSISPNCYYNYLANKKCSYFTATR